METFQSLLKFIKVALKQLRCRPKCQFITITAQVDPQVWPNKQKTPKLLISLRKFANPVLVCALGQIIVQIIRLDVSVTGGMVRKCSLLKSCW